MCGGAQNVLNTSARAGRRAMPKTNPVVEDLMRIRRELTALNNMKIHVGIQGDANSDLLMIAAVHEYGCTIKVTPKMRGYFRYNFGVNLKASTGYINIPERSFIRASYDSGKQGIDGVIRMAVGRVVKDRWTAKQAAENIGLFCVQMTQDFINSGQVTPPKSQFTQERSSQYTPLFDSGRLVGSITYKIEGG